MGQGRSRLQDDKTTDNMTMGWQDYKTTDHWTTGAGMLEELQSYNVNRES